MTKSTGEKELSLHPAPRVKEEKKVHKARMQEDLALRSRTISNFWKRDAKSVEDEQRRKKIKTTASDLTPAQLARKEELEKSIETETNLIKIDQANLKKSQEETARLGLKVRSRQKAINGMKSKVKNIQNF